MKIVYLVLSVPEDEIEAETILGKYKELSLRTEGVEMIGKITEKDMVEQAKKSMINFIIDNVDKFKFFSRF